MKTIAIINQKGGCAKTVTAINLASCIASRGYKTLVVDLDPQANCSQSIGVFAFDHGIAELFENPKTTLRSVVNPTNISNLAIVPSDLSLSQVEWQLLKAFKPGHTNILRDKLDKAGNIDYDYCVIDCPPSLGLFSLNALMASDRVLIPVGLDPFAMIGLKYLTGIVDDIRMNSNKTLKILGIVRTLWDMRQSLGREISNMLEKDYPGKIMNPIIKNTVRVKESVVAQVPMVLYEPNAPASIQYQELAQEVLTSW